MRDRRRAPLTSRIWRSCRRDRQTLRRGRRPRCRLDPGRGAAGCSDNGHTAWGSRGLSGSRRNIPVPLASGRQRDDAGRTGNRGASAVGGTSGTSRSRRAQSASRNAPCRSLNKAPAAGYMPHTILGCRRSHAWRYAVLRRSENTAALAAVRACSNCRNTGDLRRRRRLGAVYRSPRTHVPGVSKAGKSGGRLRAGLRASASARSGCTPLLRPDRMRNRSNRCFHPCGVRLSGRSGRTGSSFL